MRRRTREVRIGERLRIGGHSPIAIQSMTNTPLESLEATVAQIKRLAEAGAALVRLAVPNLAAVDALAMVAQTVRRQGLTVPLAADVHFLPTVALRALECVEKVRINPGNFIRPKAISEEGYGQYLYDSVAPFFERAKQLGRAVRIGVNHGSLSERILQRYGNTPEGMVISALEFIQVAEAVGFFDTIVSFKASRVPLMVAAYRLAAERMDALGMHYPFHLGVTEAGYAEEGIIKSTVGMGILLQAGIGDTLRVSLTGDPVQEIPVAKLLVEKAQQATTARPSQRQGFCAGAPGVLWETSGVSEAVQAPSGQPLAGVVLPLPEDRASAAAAQAFLQNTPGFYVAQTVPSWLETFIASSDRRLTFVVPVGQVDSWLPLFRFSQVRLACIGNADAVATRMDDFRKFPQERWFFSPATGEKDPFAAYEDLFRVLGDWHGRLWLRGPIGIMDPDAACVESAWRLGILLERGLGSTLSITGSNVTQSLGVAYGILQALRICQTRAEFIVCPSCGRTRFDIESVAKRIKTRMQHLQHLTIGVMGCTVNGPGEMAGADFGYVGAAPGEVNLYVGTKCVAKGIPEEKALEKLVEIIKIEGKWKETL